MIRLRQFAVPVIVAARGIPSRLGTSLVIVIGVAIVVAVFVSALALAVGFQTSARRTGHSDRAVILRDGTSTEAASTLSQDDVVAILNAAGIRSVGGATLGSAETLAFAALADNSSGRNVFVTLRGIGPQALRLRPEIRITEGRTFRPGTREVIVGRAALRKLRAVGIGSHLSLPQGEWQVVGVFASGGDSHESEFMTDAATLMSAYRRDVFNSVTVALEGPESIGPLRVALAADPTLSVDTIREDSYFARTSRPLSELLSAIAFGIGGIMMFGAAFGAITTMYAVTNARSSEIATLRAIGFGPGSAMASVLVESLALSACGAVCGVAIATAAFDGASVSTMAGGASSQVAFALHMTPGIIATGVAAACAIGFIGGFLPAARAGHRPIAAALRG